MDLNETQILNHRGDESDGQKNQVGTLYVGISEYPIFQGFNRIGRARPCSIVLEDATVSRVHAEIHAGSESAFITDLGSVNGTTFKDLTLKRFYFYPINDGDVIIFGGVKAIFEKTPRTPVATESLRRPRESPYSLPRLAIDSTFNESNGSVVMGSQQIDPQRRLFRQPATPVNRSNNGARISGNVASPGGIENLDQSGKGDDSSDIYTMETQNILAPETPAPKKETQVKKSVEPGASSKNVDQSVEDVHEMETQNMLEPALQPRSGKTLSGSSKRDFAPERYRKAHVNDSSDIYDLETQEMVDRESFVAPKRPKLEKTAEVLVQEADDSVYEAQTQVLRMPDENPKIPENRCTEENAPKEASVIAETDDESKSEDEMNERSKRCDENQDLSDGSITDDENRFATFPTEIEARTGAKVSPQTSTVSPALKNQSKPETNAQKTTFTRASSTTRIVDDESDLDLLPTQVLDVMTSTPMSRRWNVPADDIDESQVVLDDLDIHNVLTQVVPANGANSPDSSTKIPEKLQQTIEQPKEKENDDANDTLEKNLGNIFGNDSTSEAEPTDEPTQLMTQNLVDILKPTQIPVRETTPSPTIPESLEKTKSPNDKENESREIIGFVDGRAVDNQNRTSRARKSTTPDASEIRPGNSGEKTLERENSDHSLPPCSEDDDIFFGLPKVRICGTLSNPASPASSETSENELVWLKKRGNHGKTGSGTKRKLTSMSTRSKVDETRDQDSPVLSRKSRVMGKNVSCNRIGEDDDNDSDEDLDYNELKKIADRLLASGSSTETNVRKATGFPGLNVERSLPKNESKRRPTRKLSETPSSLAVADPNESDTSEDASENTVAEQSSTRGSRKRPRESAKKTITRKRAMKKESSEESRKADDAVGPNDRLTPVMTQNQHAQVHLTRINVSDLKAKKKVELSASEVATPKDTRQSIAKTVNDPAPSPTTPSRSRGRRTIEPNVSLTKQHHKVLFTGVKDEDYEKMVMKLGETVVSDPAKATVLITDKVRRTFKFLCAVAQGIQVVSVNWLVESFNAGHSLDCDKFILQDPEAEEKFKFKLAKSLNAARKSKFLSGFTILITPKVVQPEIHEIKGMVEASGGRVLVRVGARSWSDKMVILSRKDDLAAAKAIISKAPKGTNISVQSTEFLLTGILRQEVNLVDYKLL